MPRETSGPESLCLSGQDTTYTVPKRLSTRHLAVRGSGRPGQSRFRRARGMFKYDRWRKLVAGVEEVPGREQGKRLISRVPPKGGGR